MNNFYVRFIISHKKRKVLCNSCNNHNNNNNNHNNNHVRCYPMGDLNPRPPD